MAIRLFKHHIPLPFLLLGAAEFVLLMASVYVGAYLRFFDAPATLQDDLGNLASKALPYAVVMLSAIVAMGLYRSRTRHTGVETLIRLGVSFVLGGVGLALMFYVFPGLYFGRGVLALAVLSAFISISIARLIFLRVVDENIFRRRLLVLGTGQKAFLMTRLRRKSDQRNFKIVGFVGQQDEGDSLVDPNLIIDGSPSLMETVHNTGAEEIVVAIDDRRKALPVRDLLECKLAGTRIIDVASFFERETSRVRLDLLYPSWVIFSDGFVANSFNRVLKRAFDIVASASVLLLTWPLMLIFAVLVVLETGLPVLYRQERVGLKGKTFNVLKFRSMVVDAEKLSGAQWATENDPRVTRVGGVMRKYRIDELPQLWNILRGDMSIVGPRPERPEFVELLAQTIPYYSERHCAKPGMTGWAQLCYQYGSSEDDAAEKLQYDLYYVKNQGIMFDLFILLQTAEVVLMGKGAR